MIQWLTTIFVNIIQTVVRTATNLKPVPSSPDNSLSTYIHVKFVEKRNCLLDIYVQLCMDKTIII